MARDTVAKPGKVKPIPSAKGRQCVLVSLEAHPEKQIVSVGR
jgi:hypothetical protein